MADSTYTPMALWGRELRHYRKKAGLTQTEFAAKINYSPSFVPQIETGHVPAGVRRLVQTTWPSAGGWNAD
jgi:transcriptional regulator with XRE-family HTH domain